MRRATILPAVFITLAVMACNLTSAKEEASDPQELKVPGPTSAATVVVAPVESTAVEEVSAQTDIVTDPDVFQADLLQTVSDKNFDAFGPLMGSAFSLGYWQSEGGIISTGDAVNLMRDDLLSGPDPVSFELNVDPGSVVNDDIANYSPGMVRAIFSTGWGTSGEDEAILFIAPDDTGDLYWQGLLYARGGFGSSVEIVLPGAEPTEAPPPEQQDVAHGNLIYEHDFLSGWLETEVINGTMEHVPEGYQFAVVEQALWTYSTKAKQGAFYAELEATPGQCPSGQGNYGLLFHFQDDTHYRLFVVWCSGLYSLFQRETSNSIFTISEGNLPAGIDTSTGQHKLAVHAVDNVLRLYVDNYLVTTQGVSNMPEGDFGPYAETTGGFPMTVVFNRIAIYQP